MSSATTNISTASPGHDSHGDGHGHGKNPHLAHHFDTPEQQYASAKLGMWMFLGTEILMFGGLFCAYSIYRHNHPAVFAFAAEAYLNVKLGTLNTIILISSSLTMAWGVRAAQLNHRKNLIICLILTLMGAAGFMVIKTIEYTAKWNEQVWIGQWNKYNPGFKGNGAETPPAQPVVGKLTAPTSTAAPAASEFDGNAAKDVSAIQPRYNGPTGLAPAAVAAAPEGTTEADRDELTSERYRALAANDQWRVSTFFSLYFLMTGLHGLHVLVGMGLISWLTYRAYKGSFSSEYYTPVDLIGLYWHLVDLIWIFLYPLLYLIH